jgi:hypothetical protein
MKLALLTGMLIAASVLSARAETKYENNFEKAQIGSVPDDFLVLDGNFAVKEDSGNKFLELPGAPLDTYGVLFGPNEKENVAVSARFFASAKGRRYPVFDVGLNGVGGYKLRVSPAKKQLELYRGDALKKSVPLHWQPGKWTSLKLEVLKSGDKEWKIEGKEWQEGASEPSSPAITLTDSEAPANGRASVSGMPYSGTPIRFDDFVVSTVPAK